MTHAERRINKIIREHTISRLRQVGRTDSHMYSVIRPANLWGRPVSIELKNVLTGQVPAIGKVCAPCNLICKNTGKYCTRHITPGRVQLCRGQFWYVCAPEELRVNTDVVSNIRQNPAPWRIEFVRYIDPDPSGAPRAIVITAGNVAPTYLSHADIIRAGAGALNPGSYIVPCAYRCGGVYGKCKRKSDVFCRAQFWSLLSASSMASSQVR